MLLMSENRQIDNMKGPSPIMRLWSKATNVVRSTFWRALVTVLSGSVIAQSIPIIGYLFIARIFAPGEFGIFAAWLGVVSVLGVGLTMRLEKTYVILAGKSERTQGLFATLVVILSNLLCVGLGVFMVSFFVALPVAPPVIALCLLAAGLTAFVQSLMAWLGANGFFKSLSFARISQTFFIAIFQIGFGLFKANSLSIMGGYIIGQLFCILAVWAVLSTVRRSWSATRFSLVGVKRFIVKHKKFPIFSLPADLTNAFTAQFPVVFIGAYIGVLEAGVYAMAIKVLGAPIGLLGAAVLDVFRREAAIEYRESGACKQSYGRTFRVLTTAAIFMVFGVYFLADFVFTTFFGDQWALSAEIAILLLPMFAMRLVASPLSYIVYIADRQQVDLVWQIALLIVTLLAFFISDGFLDTLFHFGSAYAVMYVIYLLISYQIAQGRR